MADSTPFNFRTYHKIHSPFKRNKPKNGRMIWGDWSIPEFNYLKDARWEFQEKIDGMNIRVGWDGEAHDRGEMNAIHFGGRTGNTDMPKELDAHLRSTLTTQKLLTTFFQQKVILYGEGYGKGIQNGGDYGDTQRFILFDVFVYTDEPDRMIKGWWLNHSAVEAIAQDLDIPCARIIDYGTIEDAFELCKNGFSSHEKKTEPEGLVIRPSVRLNARSGARIISKVKIKDIKDGFL